MADPVWADGAAYEAYVGRWSRLVARDFLRLLALPPGLRWLDVGCGTGALTATVLAESEPAQITGVDPAPGFLAHARDRVDDPRAAFEVGDARALPVADASVDVVVSGLALNFVPEPAQAVAEFARVLRPGGVAAAYVWDYAEGMAMMRHFWAAAEVLDPAVAELSDERRFPLCRPGALRALWTAAGFAAVAVRPVVVPTVFPDVAAYWTPFLGGQGAAPAYVASLAGPDRTALRDLLVSRLPVEADGSVRLTARAWAVHGTAPS
jgi:SAM-dependent methyltransferase